MTTPVTIDEVIEELKHANGVILELGNVDEDNDDVIDWRDYRKTLNDLIDRIRQHGIAQESLQDERECFTRHIDNYAEQIGQEPEARWTRGRIFPREQPYIDQLIGEIDGLQKVDIDDFGVPYPASDGDYIYSEDMRVTLDKWRGVK